MDLDEHTEGDSPVSYARQRLLAFGVAVVVILAAIAVAASVGVSGTTPGAPPVSVRASAAAVSLLVPGREPQRIAAAQPVAGVSARESASHALYTYPADGSLVTARQLWATATVDATGASSRSRVDAGAIELFEGRVKLTGVSLRDTATIDGGRAGGGLQLNDGARLLIDGERTPLTANRQLVVDGIGTVSINEQAIVSHAPKGDEQTGPRFRAIGAIVHVRLTRGYKGLPAGTELLIGRVEAGVRQGRIVAVPHPGPAPVTAPPAPGGTRLQAGKPRPGESTLPRRTTAVRARASAAHAGSLQGYVFPVLGASSYTNDWGAPRASTGRGHQGNDIFANEGTPLVAVADGVLDRVGWNQIGGYRFWLHDRYGNAFYYAHLSAFSPLAVDGAQVRAGDVIGFVGRTGDAVGTPPHVHFEIHPGNRGPVNPFPFLNAWKQGLAVAIDALSAAGASEQRLPSLALLQVADISATSGVGQTVLQPVPVTRPVEEEHAPMPTDESLSAAISGSAIDSSPSAIER